MKGCLMTESYEGVVEDVDGDRVLVVYDVNGDIVEQTYEKSQFIDGRLPEVGSRLAVHVVVSEVPPMKLDWDGLLRVILTKSYASEDAGRTDDDDVAVMAVLLSLHAAVRGEHDLVDLASACVQLHKGRK